MSLEFVNRICPNCKNPNYMVLLGDLSEAYKYKCMNCHRYFNDVDFEELLQPVWKVECMNTKVDMIEVIRCKDCKKHGTNECPMCKVYIFDTADYWYCADAERKDGDEDGKA